MRQYTVVTGPLLAYTEEVDLITRTIHREYLAFSDSINNVLMHLEKQGAVNIEVTCQPIPTKDGWHVAYISYGEQPATSATLTVKDAAARLGFGRSTVHEMVRRGDIRAVRAGRRVQIPVTEVDRLLAGSPPTAAD